MQFKEFHFDGTALDVLHEETAFDARVFPDANQLQWKILQKKIALYKMQQQQPEAQHARRIND